MADKNIGSLPAIASLNDDSLLVVEQQGAAGKMTGRQFRAFGEAAVSSYVKDAAQSATDAAKSAAAAANSAAAAAGSAQTAQEYSGKPPIIQDGTWWTWNATTQKYVDTGEAARGSVMYATFYVDAATGDLYMVTDNEYTGPTFRLNGADLEVVLNYG